MAAITPEMISEGVGALIDYETGGMNAGEAVAKIYLAMQAVSTSRNDARPLSERLHLIHQALWQSKQQGLPAPTVSDLDRLCGVT